MGLFDDTVTALHRSRFVILMTAMSLAAHSADYGGRVFAQAGAYHETGTAGTTAVLAGGGAGYAPVSRAEIFAEFNYVPVSSTALGDFALSGHVLLVGGGIRAYLNSRGNIVRAYVPVVGGFAKASAQRESFFGGGNFEASVTGSYFGTGFGVEIGPRRFGVRPEVRYLRELVSGGPNGNALVAMAGFYYRF